MKPFKFFPGLNPTKLFSSMIISMSMLAALTLAAPAEAKTLITNGEGSASAAKEVVSKLVAEDFEAIRANFNEQMRQGLSAEKMKEVWEASLQYHGQFKSQGQPVHTQDQGYDVFLIKCEMERSPMEVVVAYDRAGKIGGLWVRPARS